MSNGITTKTVIDAQKNISTTLPPKANLAEADKAAASIAAATPSTINDEVNKVVTPVVQTGVAEELEFTEPSDLDIIMDASIQARPLALPDILKVKLRDPHYVPRWVNFKSMSGSWYNRMVACGFMPCTPQDVVSHHGEVQEKEGKLVMGDLMLMKIDRVKHAGFIKHNYLQSVMKTSSEGAHRSAIDAGMSQLKTDLPSVPASYLNDKVQMFKPTEQDINALDKK